MPPERTRREVLGLTAGAAAAMATAGCLGGDDAGSGAGVEDWRTAQLEDALTGTTFTIAGIGGPVFVHPFAIWCSTCKRQNDRLDGFQRDDGPTVVQLNIGSDEGSDDVASYAEENGYARRARFAVASEGVAGAIADEFGASAVSPPQSPVILECPDGTTTEIEKVADSRRLEDALDGSC